MVFSVRCHFDGGTSFNYGRVGKVRGQKHSKYSLLWEMEKTNYSVCQDFHTTSIVLGGAGKIFVQAQLSNYLTPKRTIENDFKRGLLVQKVLQFVRMPNSRIIALWRNLAASLIGQWFGTFYQYQRWFKSVTWPQYTTENWRMEMIFFSLKAY